MQVARTPLVVHLACMPVGGEGEHVGHVFILPFSRSSLTDWVGGRKSGVGVSLLSAGRVWYVCQRFRRADTRHIFSFSSSDVQCSRSGGRRVRFSAALYHRSRDF